MCNAIKKYLTYGICIASTCIMASCGSKTDPKQEEAQQLIEQINSALENGNAEEALALMHDVDSLYPDRIEERKIVRTLRPKAMEILSMRQIAVADSLIASAQMEIAALQPLLKHISGNGLEGYYVVSNAYNPNFINSTTFEARVNDANFLFYIVAQNTSGNIGISSVELKGNGDSKRSEPISSRANQSAVIEGSELASFMPEEVDELGRWAWENSSDVKSGAIIGAKGTKSIKFTPQQAASFGVAWRYANQKQQERNALMLREKLDRQLQIARDQSAQLIPDTEE